MHKDAPTVDVPAGRFAVTLVFVRCGAQLNFHVLVLSPASVYLRSPVSNGRVFCLRMRCAK